MAYNPLNTIANAAAAPSFEDKYKQNIAGLAKTNNVDLGVAKDMLISNLTKGGQYKGGGVLDFNAATPDANAYVDQARQQSLAKVPNQTAAAQPDFQGRINAIHDASQKYKLAQLQASQNKALGQVNLQEQQAMPQYQNLRNQRDVGNAAAVQQLREQMAAWGLTNSGDNGTEMTNLKIARENQQGDINLQQQQFLNTLQQRRADIMDPSQEQAILGEADLARNQALLNELYQGDQRNFRNSQFAYQQQRDTSNDAFRDTQFNYQKEWDQKKFDEDVRRYGLQNAMQLSGITGFYDGKPTFAREQYNADQAYKMAQLEAVKASRASGGGSGSAGGSSGGAVKTNKAATQAFITELKQYDTYEQAANDFSKFFEQMKGQGVDTDAVGKALREHFRNTERTWIDNPGAADDAYMRETYGN